MENSELLEAIKYVSDNGLERKILKCIEKLWKRIWKKIVKK